MALVFPSKGGLSAGSVLCTGLRWGDGCIVQYEPALLYLRKRDVRPQGSCSYMRLSAGHSGPVPYFSTPPSLPHPGLWHPYTMGHTTNSELFLFTHGALSLLVPVQPSFLQPSTESRCNRTTGAFRPWRRAPPAGSRRRRFELGQAASALCGKSTPLGARSESELADRTKARHGCGGRSTECRDSQESHARWHGIFFRAPSLQMPSPSLALVTAPVS
jgi:hypothetical protein